MNKDEEIFEKYMYVGHESLSINLNIKHLNFIFHLLFIYTGDSIDKLQILDFVFISYYWYCRIYYNHIIHGFENDPENNPKNEGFKWKECSEKPFIGFFFF